MSWYAYFCFCYISHVLSGISVVQYNTAFLSIERYLFMLFIYFEGEGWKYGLLTL